MALVGAQAPAGTLEIVKMTFQREVEARIATFKDCLIKEGVEQALTAYVLQHGSSVLGAEMEGKLRTTIAERWEIDGASVFLVGSAKLGFSPKPGQYFKAFSASSDIDIAIVSSDLYATIWREVQQMYSAGEYFDFDAFKHYHLAGWIRPDKMPSQNIYRRCREWWDYFRELSSREDLTRTKIRAGLYYSEYFLRHYQLGGLNNMREHLIAGKT